MNDIEKIVKLNRKKNIALAAHDQRKKDLIEWIKINKDILKNHNLFGTGTTGKLIEEKTGLKVLRFKSGPLGGDIQIGSAIIENKIDILIFYWDPLEAQPHDPDIKALLRIAVLYNIPVACNSATADFIISSIYINEEYEP